MSDLSSGGNAAGGDFRPLAGGIASGANLRLSVQDSALLQVALLLLARHAHNAHFHGAIAAAEAVQFRAVDLCAMVAESFPARSDDLAVLSEFVDLFFPPAYP